MKQENPLRDQFFEALDKAFPPVLPREEKREGHPRKPRQLRELFRKTDNGRVRHAKVRDNGRIPSG